MKKLYYVFAAVGLLGVIGWVVTYPRQQAAVRLTRNSSRLVTTVAPSAFGDFSTSTVLPAQPQSASPSRETASTTAGTADAMKVMPVQQTVTFSYDGPVPIIPTLSVLKRVPTEQPENVMSSILRQGNPAITLDAFRDLRLDSYSVSEADPSGYTITQDFRQGITSIYRQYAGAMEKLIAPSILAPEKPAVSDQESVAIAKAFLAAHQVDLTHYGTPVVQSSGVFANDTSALSARPMVWSPISSVIFPWLIQGTPVVDQSGFPYGLQVTIDTSTRTVSGASNIASLHFNGSSYPLVTDSQRVVEVAKRGGVYATKADGTSTAVTVPLQTPTAVYMISKYQLANDDADYLIPAWMFLLGQVPDGVTVYQSAVVVPFVESLLTPPEIQPAATTTGTGTSSVGSAIEPSAPTIVPLRE